MENKEKFKIIQTLDKKFSGHSEFGVYVNRVMIKEKFKKRRNAYEWAKANIK